MMSQGPLDNLANGSARCPTCGAVQEWSDVCRRCRCDLSLLRRMTEAARSSRRSCLWALRTGRIPDAIRRAQEAYAIYPDQSAARLVAVCHLLEGDWSSATAMANIAER